MHNKLATIALSSLVALTAVLGTEKLYGKNDQKLTEDKVREIVLDTIQKHPEAIVQSMTAHMEAQQKAQLEKAKVAVKEHKAQIFSSSHPSAGNQKGNIDVAIFYDYQCGHCKHMTSTINEVIKGDPQVRFVFIDLPIFGGNSITFAKMGLAAAQQGKFMEAHEALMKAPAGLKEADAFALLQKLGLNIDELKKDMASAEIDKALQENMKLAQAIGLGGTPAIIVDDELNPGAMPKEALLAMIKTKRQAAKV